jgi:hypothetical protein
MHHNLIQEKVKVEDRAPPRLSTGRTPQRPRIYETLIRDILKVYGWSVHGKLSGDEICTADGPGRGTEYHIKGVQKTKVAERCTHACSNAATHAAAFNDETDAIGVMSMTGTRAVCSSLVHDQKHGVIFMFMEEAFSGELV